MLVSLVDQIAEVNNQTIVEALDGFCIKLPDKLSKPCQLISEIFGPLLIDMQVIFPIYLFDLSNIGRHRGLVLRALTTDTEGHGFKLQLVHEIF